MNEPTNPVNTISEQTPARWPTITQTPMSTSLPNRRKGARLVPEHQIGVHIQVLSEAFRFLWMKSVTGFDPNQHCARCLLGQYRKELPYGGARRGQEYEFVIEQGEAPFHYLCGVTGQWENNLHVPFIHKPGYIAVHRNHDVMVTLENAEILPISALPADARMPDGSVFTAPFFTCRNYQFGYRYLRDV